MSLKLESWRFYSVSILIIPFIIAGCMKSEYDRLEEREMASQVRYDSIFLGLHFGMPRKDFFTSCWEMNKQGLIIQGPGNLSVEYELDTPQVKSKVFMRFYPKFTPEDVIYTMPVEFTYEAWAPWNQHLSPDSLLVEIKYLFEKWYGGNKFIYIENKDKNIQLWAKIDGNRRIRLYTKNISTVKADITDLTAKVDTRAPKNEDVD